MKKPWLLDSVFYVTGSVLYALSVSVFSAPNDMAPGGVAGLAIIANALFEVPVGAVTLLLNVPLIAAAFLKLSKRYARRTLLVIAVSSIVMDLTAPLVPPFQEDRLLAALFGGLLAGVGVGMIMLRDAGTGGSEIVARLMQKRRPHVSVGRMLMVVDAAVVALSAVVFGEVASALYAAVQVFVCSVTIDQVVYGREEGRLLMIVTTQREALCAAITERLSRGVTMLDAKGGYRRENSALLLCAVSRSQVPQLKSLSHRIDPHAFVMVVTTQQVVGEGFLPPDGAGS